MEAHPPSCHCFSHALSGRFWQGGKEDPLARSPDTFPPWARPRLRGRWEELQTPGVKGRELQINVFACISLGFGFVMEKMCLLLHGRLLP